MKKKLMSACFSFISCSAFGDMTIDLDNWNSNYGSKMQINDQDIFVIEEQISGEITIKGKGNVVTSGDVKVKKLICEKDVNFISVGNLLVENMFSSHGNLAFWGDTFVGQASNVNNSILTFTEHQELYTELLQYTFNQWASTNALKCCLSFGDLASSTLTVTGYLLKLFNGSHRFEYINAQNSKITATKENLTDICENHNFSNRSKFERDETFNQDVVNAQLSDAYNDVNLSRAYYLYKIGAKDKSSETLIDIVTKNAGNYFNNVLSLLTLFLENNKSNIKPLDWWQLLKCSTTTVQAEAFFSLCIKYNSDVAFYKYLLEQLSYPNVNCSTYEERLKLIRCMLNNYSIFKQKIGDEILEKLIHTFLSLGTQEYIASYYKVLSTKCKNINIYEALLDYLLNHNIVDNCSNNLMSLLQFVVEKCQSQNDNNFNKLIYVFLSIDSNKNFVKEYYKMLRKKFQNDVNLKLLEKIQSILREKYNSVEDLDEKVSLLNRVHDLLKPLIDYASEEKKNDASTTFNEDEQGMNWGDERFSYSNEETYEEPKSYRKELHANDWYNIATSWVELNKAAFDDVIKLIGIQYYMLDYCRVDFYAVINAINKKLGIPTICDKNNNTNAIRENLRQIIMKAHQDKKEGNTELNSICQFAIGVLRKSKEQRSEDK